MSESRTDWTELKAQYERIHAPRELEERLRKMENEFQTKKCPSALFLWGRRAAVCLCAAVVGLSVAANASASAAETLQKIPVIGAITKVVTFASYRNGDAQIQTPHLEGLGDKNAEEKLNREFDRYAGALIAQYETDVKNMEAGAHEAVTSSYQVLVDSDSQLTIAMNTVVARGDSMETDRYYNIDKRSGKLLKLADLFKSGADYTSPINACISAEIKKDSQNYFTGEDAFRSIAENQNFYINKDGGLVIVFDEASIAPAYRGVIEIPVPTEAVAGILAEGGLVR